NNDTPSEITIALQERNLQLLEINIEDKNLRSRNLDLFKSMFIGRDYWGRNAQLLNDSVLSFISQYDYPKIMITKDIKNDIRTGAIKDIHEWDKDSTYVILKTLSDLEVIVKSPLDIDMPLLGYKLRVDLIDFSIDIVEKYVQVNFLGHYYFHPYVLENKREVKRIEKNRRTAYFNSGKHFLRSIYEQTLNENGYKIDERLKDDATSSTTYETTNFENNVNYIDNDRLQIIGLKGKEFTISYFSNTNHAPIDIRKIHRALEEYTIERSKLYFMNDTCIINKHGTFTNNEIMFGGSISQKRVGSYLPENYELED
ncbi:MAG TPA: hypothetical protein VLA03_02610, partial [Draconibacterium sp.]|nr:hypothetical protein [Draconibacterium sp.]